MTDPMADLIRDSRVIESMRHLDQLRKRTFWQWLFGL
jgi:hypothetical protein